MTSKRSNQRNLRAESGPVRGTVFLYYVYIIIGVWRVCWGSMSIGAVSTARSLDVYTQYDNFLFFFVVISVSRISNLSLPSETIEIYRHCRKFCFVIIDFYCCVENII